MSRSWFLALAATCLLSSLGCGDNSVLGSAFEERVQAALPSDEFRLDEVTEFSWERCALLTPYTTGARAEELLRARWPNFSALGLESNDSFHVLACSENGQLVGWGRIRRSIEFTEASSDRPLLPGTRFRVLATEPEHLLEVLVRSDPPPDFEP